MQKKFDREQTFRILNEVPTHQSPELDDINTLEIEFSHWKELITNAKTYNEFLTIFERLPLSTASSDLEVFFFGEEGLFSQAKNQREFPLPIDGDDFESDSINQRNGYEFSLYKTLSLRLAGAMNYLQPEMVQSFIKTFLQRSVDLCQRRIEDYYFEEVESLRVHIGKADNGYLYRDIQSLITILTKFPYLAREQEVELLKKTLKKVPKKSGASVSRTVDDQKFNFEHTQLHSVHNVQDDEWEKIENLYYSQDFANETGILSLNLVVDACAKIKNPNKIAPEPANLSCTRYSSPSNYHFK